MPTDPSVARAIVLFAHGARDPAWAEPFQRLQQRLAQRSGLPVQLAFLELMQPTLQDCLDDLASQGIRHVWIIPAFMAQGAHLRRDLPALIEAQQARHPTLHIQSTQALGEVDAVLDAMSDWICATVLPAAANSHGS